MLWVNVLLCYWDAITVFFVTVNSIKIERKASGPQSVVMLSQPALHNFPSLLMSVRLLWKLAHACFKWGFITHEMFLPSYTNASIFHFSTNILAALYYFRRWSSLKSVFVNNSSIDVFGKLSSSLSIMCEVNVDGRKMWAEAQEADDNLCSEAWEYWHSATPDVFSVPALESPWNPLKSDTLFPKACWWRTTCEKATSCVFKCALKHTVCV